jgi:hypothetical protein
MSDSDVDMPDADMPDADPGSDSEWTDTSGSDKSDAPGPDPTDFSDSHLHDRVPKEVGSRYVAQRPTVSLSLISEDSFDQGCIICLTAFDLQESTRDVIQMGCGFGHCFDRECINAWLSEKGANQNSCPICRQEFFEKQVKKEEDEEDEEEDESVLEGEWEWPQDDDGSLQWLANLIDLKAIRTDLHLYAELHREGILRIAPDPEATQLDCHEELALLKDIRRRQGQRPRSAHVPNEEYHRHLECIRRTPGTWDQFPDAWLLRIAFPA